MASDDAYFVVLPELRNSSMLKQDVHYFCKSSNALDILDSISLLIYFVRDSMCAVQSINYELIHIHIVGRVLGGVSEKNLLLLIVFIVAWLWANYQTGVRINHRRAYESAAIELDALRVIRAGDNQKAIAILENSLKSYAIDLEYFDSFLVKNRHRVAADKFIVHYEEDIVQQAAAPDASRK